MDLALSTVAVVKGLYTSLAVYLALCITGKGREHEAESRGQHEFLVIDLALRTAGEGREPDAEAELEAEAKQMHAVSTVHLVL